MYPLVPPLVPLVSGGMVSHRLPSVAFPFRLSSALSLDLLVLLSLLDLSLHTTLSPPISYFIPAYSGLILHLWILILRATHRSQQGVVTPGRVPTQLVAVCRASPAGRCRATFRRLPLSPFLGFVIRPIGLTVPIRLIPPHYLIPTYPLLYPCLFRVYPTPIATYPPSYPPLPVGCSHS